MENSVKIEWISGENSGALIKVWSEKSEEL